MNLGDELQKLQHLHQSGTLSDEEFARAKAKLLDGPPPAANLEGAPVTLAPSSDPVYIEQQTRLWGLLLHLSIFAGYIVPLGGLIVPIIIWQLKKGELPAIDAHGKNAANWIISHIIYLIVCIALSFAVIGIPLMIALVIVSIIFPIVAAIKANSGEIWRYPLSIRFFN